MNTARVRPHVARVLEQTRTVLLDSDALCELLGPDQAPSVAEAIRDQILARGHKMSVFGHLNDNPLSMLVLAHAFGPADGTSAEQILRAAELSAAATATIAPEALQVINACRSSGRRVALVSAHCPDAVERVLTLSGLRPSVGPVIGRGPITTTWNFHTIADLLRVTMLEMGEQPANCAVVGLSVATTWAAQEAGAHGIGVVNKLTNRKNLAKFGAVVVASLPALAAALTTVHPTA